MIFYGNGVVWNAKTNSKLCRFVDGKCEVTDENEIAFLVRAGYSHDPIDYGDEPVMPEQEPIADKPKRGRKANASK